MSDPVTPENARELADRYERDSLGAYELGHRPLVVRSLRSLAAQLEAAQGQLHAARLTLVKALRNSEGLERELEAAQKVIEAARRVRQGATDRDPTNDSLTEITGYDYWALVNALAAYDEQVKS